MKPQERNIVQFKSIQKKRSVGAGCSIDIDCIGDEIASLSDSARREWARITAIQNAATLLRDARSAAGLSQSEVARRTGINQSTLSRAEKMSGLELETNATIPGDGPSLGLFAIALDACGYSLELKLVPK